MTKKLLLTIAVISFAVASKAQSSHTIIASNFMFTPSALTINAGDTVFVDIQGNHTCTEISEANWMINNPISNGGFWVGQGSSTGTNWFVLSDPGMYYYICIPHAAGEMKGTINVTDTSVGIKDNASDNDFKINPLGSGNYSLHYIYSNQFVVYDLSGKQIAQQSLLNSENQLQINLSSLPEGMYLGTFNQDGVTNKTIKFMR